ncbi:MAG: hypothetical protein JNK48_19760 [Bryobacterales bacterium]|nr:hypothetical protein [Bryobacterales bacterium]
MKHLLHLAAIAALALPAAAGAETFRNIIGDAANIQRDAEKLSRDLKQKALDETQVKQDISALNQDVAKLKQDVTELDGKLGQMTEAQKKDWDLVKTKAELLTIFAARKQTLMDSGEFRKNRSMLRAHADGIAKRAAMLQQTANKLDK